MINFRWRPEASRIQPSFAESSTTRPIYGPGPTLRLCGLLLESLQNLDFPFELNNRLGCGSIIDQILFERLLFFRIEIIVILGCFADCFSECFPTTNPKFVFAPVWIPVFLFDA